MISALRIQPELFLPAHRPPQPGSHSCSQFAENFTHKHRAQSTGVHSRQLARTDCSDCTIKSSLHASLSQIPTLTRVRKSP